MIRLLAALILALGLATPAAAQPPLPDPIDFKVYRDGEEIGHHRVTFARDGDKIIADVSIQLVVTFAGVAMFRYEHASRETWQDGKLVAISSQTHDDGEDYAMTLARNGDQLRIEGSLFKGEAPGTLVPTSYWFPEMIAQTQVIDSQNGRIFPVEIVNRGRKTIEAGGKQIEATHYTLTERLEMHLWYDDQGRWVKTAFEARGSQIDYVLQPPSAPATAAN